MDCSSLHVFSRLSLCHINRSARPLNTRDLLGRGDVNAVFSYLVLILAQVFARGGMQSTTGDTPQRRGLQCTKNANASTKFPCGTCKAPQSNDPEDVGGQIGDADFDIVKHRRKREDVEEGRRQLVKAGIGTPQAAALSMKLGITEPDGLDQPRILFDVCSVHNPFKLCGAELLHLDQQVRLKSYMENRGIGLVPDFCRVRFGRSWCCHVMGLVGHGSRINWTH